MTEAALYEQTMQGWLNDWCLFAEEAMGIYLDPEQQAILRSVQHNKMTSVVSGTARGKDFVAAVAAVCFLYLMPDYVNGEPESTKVVCTAPTDRQIKNIMVPEFSKLYQKLKTNGICPFGARLVGYDIRTEKPDYFLTGFKADEHTPEAWQGLHARNIFFIVTEASGVAESIFEGIEGNLQGNSRLLLVFNHNVPTGYAANSQTSPRFHNFRLNCLSAPNVLQKKVVIPGQVDYDWVKDKVNTWAAPITPKEAVTEDGDFEFEGQYYRPNDIFRVKVLGLPPKVSTDVLVPLEWIYAANNRWKEFNAAGAEPNRSLLRIGVDPAGLGRDKTAYCFRFDNYVEKIEAENSGGVADHMAIVGKIKNELLVNTGLLSEGHYTYHPYRPDTPEKRAFAMALIDTIGEGAGVYSRLVEMNVKHVHSAKFSQAAEQYGRPLKDINEVLEFVNMRAYCYWAVREWLNPLNKTNAMLPPDADLATELSNTKWAFQSDGRIKLEKKEEIQKRIKRSPDKADALALTFFEATTPQQEIAQQNMLNSISLH